MNNPYGWVYGGYGDSRPSSRSISSRRGGAVRGKERDVTTSTSRPNPPVQSLGSTGAVKSAERGGRGAANPKPSNRGARGKRGGAVARKQRGGFPSGRRSTDLKEKSETRILREKNTAAVAYCFQGQYEGLLERGGGKKAVKLPRDKPMIAPETKKVAERTEKQIALKVAVDNFNEATRMEAKKQQPLPVPVEKKKPTAREILEKEMEVDKAELDAVSKEAIRLLENHRKEQTSPKKPDAFTGKEMEKEHIEKEIRKLQEKLRILTEGDSSKEPTLKGEQPQKSSHSEKKLTKRELEYLEYKEEAELEIQATLAEFENMKKEEANRGKPKEVEGGSKALFSRKMEKKAERNAEDKSRKSKNGNDAPANDVAGVKDAHVHKKNSNEDGEEKILFYSCPADKECCNINWPYKMTDYDFVKEKKEASRLDWPGLLLVDRSAPESSQELSTFLVREKESIFNTIDPIGRQLIEHVEIFQNLCGKGKELGDDLAVTVNFEEFPPQLSQQNSNLRPILIDGCGVARSWSPKFFPKGCIPHKDEFSDNLLLPMFPIISVAVRMILMGHKISIVLPTYYKIPYIKKDYRLKVDDYYIFNKLNERGLLTFMDAFKEKNLTDSIRQKAEDTGACVVTNDADEGSNSNHPSVYVDFPYKTSDMVFYGTQHKSLAKDRGEAHRNVSHQSTDVTLPLTYTDECTGQIRRQNQLLLKQQVFLALHLCGLLHQPPNHNYGLMILLRLAKMQGILTHEIDRFIANNPPYPVPSEEMVLSLSEPEDTAPEAAPFVSTDV